MLIFIVLVAFFAGCRSGSSQKIPPSKITVTFWHSMGRRHSIVLNQIIKEFEQQHPDIHIHSIYQGSYNSLLTNLIASCTARTNPVMSQMYESWTTRFLEHKLIMPVDDLADQYGGFDQNERQDFVMVFLKDNTWKGKLTTLPFNKSAYVLYYNCDAMKEIGMINHATGKGRAPVSWEEFRDACNKLTIRSKEEVQRYGFGIRPFIEGYTTFLFRAGGDYLDKSGKRVLFSNQTGLNTLEFLVGMINNDNCAYVESDYLSTAFGTGRIAMYVGSTASMPYNQKAVADRFEWDTAPIPYPEGKKDKARTLFQGTNVGIFKNHSPKKLRAAWLFMLHLTKTESAATWSIGTGYLPVRYSVLETDKMKKHLEENPRFKTSITLLDNGHFEPRVLIWEPMRTVITDNIEAAFNGRRSPVDTINIMTSQCKDIIRTF